ncbi:MAG: hypothetical protein ABI556_04505 [Gemmatimonadales bacterium]
MMRLVPRWIAIVVLAAACGKESSDQQAARPVQRVANGAPAAALAYWSYAKPEDTARYPAPVMVSSVARATDVPRILIARPAAGAKPVGTARNLAMQIDVLATGAQPGIFGNQAPEGSSFLVVDTKWTNVHSKQRMDKASSEGKADRTMGVGSLGAGRSAASADSVDVDVAYQVPRLADHVYLVADGIATALHPVTEEIPGGPKTQVAFTVAKLGETRDARFVFVAPTNAKDVALQFFDYKFGHVLVPIKGDAKRAAGDGTPPGKTLDKGQTAKLDVAAHSIAFRGDYGGTPAPAGWRYAVVQLGGRSRSVRSAVGDIVQIDPTKFIWLEGDGGYVYPSTGGSTTAQRFLRFTPEIYQMQEVAFLVPATADRFRLGLRAESEVVKLNVTSSKPGGLPSAQQTHKDGTTMEFLLLGSKQEGAFTVLDLAINPLKTNGQGIDIQPEQQFLLVTAAGEIRPDMAASSARTNRPPRPFAGPPSTPLRFELAFPNTSPPTGLKLRGFESEGRFKL